MSTSDRATQLEPGKLWSLLEMYELKAQPFYTAVTTLRQLRSTIENGLKSYKPQPDGSLVIEHITDPVMIGYLRDTASQFAVACKTMGADVALLVLAEMDDQIETGTATWEGIRKYAEDLDSTLKRELKLVKLLALDRSEQELYEPKEPLFGPEVESKFTVAIDDIAEAGACLALERGTATVFHLMRVMEAGLRGLAGELGISYAPSWESYISQLETLLDGKRYADLTSEQRAKRPFYQDALGDLTAIKSAWRNPTMHIVKHYDVAQAKRVFTAVEGLMQHLATNLGPTTPVEIATGQQT